MESNWEYYYFLPHVGEKKVTCLAPSHPSCKPMVSKAEQHQYMNISTRVSSLKPQHPWERGKAAATQAMHPEHTREDSS